ncbi:MAG: hypothetical protein HYW27_00620 [Candidatus Aenigmarchaeota archaeon]|nr:hypothetical protein [Candidatus Aenigmarchaeota archaeon]
MTDVDRMIWLPVGLFFVLILLVVIATIMATADPNAYIADRNTRELRDTMNFVCQNGGQKEVRFSLPQSVPYLVELFSMASGFIATKNGDPYYVLYYEAFPPGDAIGWESYYHVTDAKAVTYLPEGYVPTGDKKTIDDITGTGGFFEISRRDIDGKLSNKGTSAEMIIIGNVMLGEDFTHFINYKKSPFNSDPTSTKDRLITEFFNFGEWWYKDPATNVPEGGDNYFEFGNYNSLSPQEKAAIKYIPCGDNALCLKTRRNVYRYVLDKCGGIEHVVFAYDSTSISDAYNAALSPTGTIAVGGVARSIILRSSVEVLKYTGRVATWILRHPLLAAVLIARDVANTGHYFYSAFLAYKSSDFSIASPCEAKMTIEKMDCAGIDDAYKCGAYQKVPLYEYSEQSGIRNATGYHYTCVDKANSDIDAPQGEQLTGECLFVRVSETPEGYCWTADPYKATGGNPFTNTTMSAIASSLGFTPVRDHTSVAQTADGQATILMPFDKEKLNWKEKIAKEISWKWPNDKSDESILSDLIQLMTPL